MPWRLLFFSKLTNLRPSQTLSSATATAAATNFSPLPLPLRDPNHRHSFSTSFLVTKTPKKLRKRKKKKKDSPRTKLVQSEPNRIASLERVLERDKSLRFLIRSKQYISAQPERVLRLDDAGKLHRELGFPRGRKIARFLQSHPLIFQTYRHSDNKLWLGFTDLMDDLLEEERRIMDSTELDRVEKVRKLLMMTSKKRIPLSKLHHCRLLFGLPDDFRERVEKYPEFFRVAVEPDKRRVLELAEWDPRLAVSALEREFVGDEEKVKRAFTFSVKHGRDLDLDEDGPRRLTRANTLPLVSPYSDVGPELEPWSLEAEKYRVGVLHEFLSLTLEKRASIHHVVEFKEEFSLTKHTYHMLLKQPRTFYLAGTEMNWAVFLKDAYNENGVLLEKDPQVVFNDKLHNIAMMQELQTQ